MRSWLLRQLNVTNEFVDHIDEVQFDFQYWWVLWVGLGLLVPIGVYIFVRQRRNLATVPPKLRVALSLIRIAILALLIVVLAGPYLRLELTEKKRPVVAVLLDHSDSMQLPAGPFPSEAELMDASRAAGYSTLDSSTRLALNRITRAKLMHSALRTSRSFLESLAEEYDVRYYSFDRGVTQIGVDPTHLELPEPPNPGGPATDTGAALHHIIEDATDRDLGGVLVFSDGQNTGGRSPDEAARQVAGKGAPLFTFPVGSTQRLQDVAIYDVFTTGVVSVGDTARVAVTVRSTGFDNRSVKVELKEDDKLLDSKDLVLRGAEQQQIELTFKAEKAGAHYLTVHIPPLAEEPVYLRGNNTDVAFVRVSEEKLKVLYIEGPPRWDFRFLKNAMRRDHGLGGLVAKEPDIQLETEWRRLDKKVQPNTLPRKLDQLAEYHTIILGDVSPKMLDDNFLDLLDRAVRERGVGLIVSAGPLAMPHAHGDKLHSLLPVRLNRKAAGRLPQGTPSFRMELAPEGVLREAMRFHEEPGRNQNIWANLPPYYWCAATTRAAPAANVLVYNSTISGDYGKVPLIAQHDAGKGRVLFVGTDETFRWRQNVGDRFFYTFWGQSIRAVARRDPKLAKKSWIEVRPVRCQPNEPAQIELMALTPDGAPVTADEITVNVEEGGKREGVRLAPDSAVKGRYLGKFVPKKPGEYTVVYTPGGKAEPATAKLRVGTSPIELREPNVDRDALKGLAEAGGGQMLKLDELPTIKKKLTGSSRETTTPSERTLWDNGLLLGLLILLYSLDVGIRRLMGLS